MLLQINNVNKSYAKMGKRQQVLKDITFSINKGECMGLVGESGSGKSTLSRLILGLEKVDDGSITIENKSIRQWINHKKGKMSVVFQDYTSSANPNFTVEEVIKEPMKALGSYGKEEINKRIDYLLNKVGLDKELKEKYPHELSGGQLQRVCIARAISTEPDFIVFDEAVSSLDVSIQWQILKILKELKEEMNMTYLFITHDLQSVSYLCDKIIFLYKGHIEEIIKSNELYKVKSDYSKKLVSSVITFEL